jgi:hypothetical protein
VASASDSSAGRIFWLAVGAIVLVTLIWASAVLMRRARGAAGVAGDLPGLEPATPPDAGLRPYTDEERDSLRRELKRRRQQAPR